MFISVELSTEANKPGQQQEPYCGFGHAWIGVVRNGITAGYYGQIGIDDVIGLRPRLADAPPNE